MKWLLPLLLLILLSSCLYIEGAVIEEPKDVVVDNSLSRFAVWEKCGLIDVSNPDPNG